MIAILVVSMVQGVFAQQIIIKGTVKDATSKKAAEYVNVVLQTADSVFCWRDYYEWQRRFLAE